MADEPTNIQNQNEEINGGAPAGQQAQQNTAPAAQNQQQNNSNLRTFTQEQLDAIIARERSKAVKGLFTAEQMAAKDSSISALTTERDTANANIAKLQAELDGYKNEKFLAAKGVPSDMVDFYAFKIGKLVTDKKTFEQAAEEYIKGLELHSKTLTLKMRIIKRLKKKLLHVMTLTIYKNNIDREIVTRTINWRCLDGAAVSFPN